MKKIFFFLASLVIALNSTGQDPIEKNTNPIVEEGKRLYQSEMASWYGTDVFLEKYTATENIGGYFSYSDGEIVKCIFFAKGDTPKVIGTISFNNTYDVKTAKSDLSERSFTKTENDLFSIRSHALKEINSDTIFKRYNNTNFNLIPLISNGERKVYILTGPKQSGIVIFGNDYLLTFDDNNNLASKKQLHRNIISIKYGEKTEEGNEIVGAIHTHLPETGDFITATDICTLMLYEKFAKWKQHTVVSANYVSIWNCETDILITLHKDAIKKIEKDQKKRRRNN